jgi:hypothetical protein
MPRYTVLRIPGVPGSLERRADRELVHELFKSPVRSWLIGKPDSLDYSPPLLERLERIRRPAPSARPAEETAAAHSPRAAREPDEVHLGTAAPSAVAAGEAFVARFAAYTQACRSEVRRIFQQEAPLARPRLGLERCRWQPGTTVTVRLGADQVEVANPVQSFSWNGTWQVLRFDARVHADAAGGTIILRFDVAVEGLPLLTLRPELSLVRDSPPRPPQSPTSVEAMAPRTAFASYARGDRREVLGRVRSLQIFTGIDVFLDCLSIRPGEEWKPKLSGEIRQRDVFWLFWSRTARASEWVDWEWRTALRTKSLGAIQPHPLEPVELAPPPDELSALEFGSMYEWYLVALSQSWFSRRLRHLWHAWSSAWGAMRRGAGRAARKLTHPTLGN